MTSAAQRQQASSGGLRQLKKARTTAAIQRHAMRLFHENGYGATTVEAVAAAAEVAPSTVYRYFPTKEDLVVNDEYDYVFVDRFRERPADEPVIDALLAAMHDVVSLVPPDDLVLGVQRTRLMLTEPALRGAMLTSLLTIEDVLAGSVAERTGRTADDAEVRWFTSVLIGIVLMAMRRCVDEPDVSAAVGMVEYSLNQLKVGMPF